MTPDEIEKELREMAVTDWNKFKMITGLDIVQYTICKQKKKGTSIRAIANRMKMPRTTINDRCKKCP